MKWAWRRQKTTLPLVGTRSLIVFPVLGLEIQNPYFFLFMNSFSFFLSFFLSFRNIPFVLHANVIKSQDNYFNDQHEQHMLMIMMMMILLCPFLFLLLLLLIIIITPMKGTMKGESLLVKRWFWSWEMRISKGISHCGTFCMVQRI